MTASWKGVGRVKFTFLQSKPSSRSFSLSPVSQKQDRCWQTTGRYQACEAASVIKSTSPINEAYLLPSGNLQCNFWFVLVLTLLQGGVCVSHNLAAVYSCVRVTPYAHMYYAYCAACLSIPSLPVTQSFHFKLAPRSDSHEWNFDKAVFMAVEWKMFFHSPFLISCVKPSMWGLLNRVINGVIIC